MNKARYVVPNFFTSSSFLIAVWSILIACGLVILDSGFKFNNYELASYMVVFSVLLDKLDGFAAKIFNAYSDFGAQFDSLADLVAFGIAPAIIITFALKETVPEWYQAYKIIVWVSMSVYVLCAAMRLAKYNAVDIDGNPDYFAGMPSTFAGALNVILVILAFKYDFFTKCPEYLIAFPMMLIATGVLMVSPLYLPKLKSRKSKIINIGQIILIILTYISGFSMKFPEFLFAEVVIYAVIGFGYGLVKKGIIDQGALPVEG
ncbi:MAG: CDP-alcohol phosphatidyltransferase family protein [Fibrobacterales bacterium]